MALSLVTNIASFRAQRNLAKTTNQLTGNIERLSSGLRINRAGDDAARSSISAQIGAQILGIGQAMRNANDAVSLTQTAEGALAQNNDIISRMRELAVQASNEGTMDATERGYLDQEFQLLESELNRIVAVTEFNGTKLIDGSLSAGTSFQVGFRNSSGDRISISINDSDATQLGLNDELLTSATGAQAAISALDTALQTVATARASLGASENRLAMTISSLGAYHENMSATNSRLRDADIAEETAAFTRNQILTSAGTSVLAQANAIPQSALALLG
ncbi:MAG: flagellin [Myxococcota bacterium]|nr:flagellin [Myxococcota bacterium]